MKIPEKKKAKQRVQTLGARAVMWEPWQGTNAESTLEIK